MWPSVKGSAENGLHAAFTSVLFRDVTGRRKTVATGFNSSNVGRNIKVQFLNNRRADNLFARF